MKRVSIHHEGANGGPFGELAGPWMANWRQAQIQQARAEAVGDELRTVLFRAASLVALIRTTDGRQN